MAYSNIKDILLDVENILVANRKRGQTTNIIIRDGGKMIRLGERKIKPVSDNVACEIIDWKRKP